jgi:hypothetical protein
MVGAASALDLLERELTVMCNAEYESAAFQRYIAPRWNEVGVRRLKIQMYYFAKNRRDCWGYVQGAAPLDVKRLVWAHEQEELLGDPATGAADHLSLIVQEGAPVGLTAENFERTPPADGALACFYAWLHLAMNRPWLEAIAASAILEIKNSDLLMRGGGWSHRASQKITAELGIPLKDQPNLATHMEADVEHGNLLMQVARVHAQTAEAQEAIRRGARDSLAIGRAFWDHLAVLMAE